MRSLCHILLAAGILTGPAFGAEGIPIPKSIENFFETHCYDCHDEATSKGDLNLEGLTRSITNNTDALNWQDILDQPTRGKCHRKRSRARRRMNWPEWWGI